MEGLDLTDKPVTIFHGKMFTPKNLTPLKDLGGEGGKCVIWGDVFFTEVKGNYRKIYTVSQSPTAIREQAQSPKATTKGRRETA